MEQWKEFIKGYEVSNLGNVRSYFSTHGIVDTPHPLHQSINYKGRPIIRIRVNNIKKTFCVHRIVLEAFVGKCPIGMQACHYDDNPMNNRIENLRWDTWQNNVIDGLRNQTAARGEKQRSAKLTNEEVLDICQKYAKGIMSGILAKEFGVTTTTIREITSGRSWKHLGGKVSSRNDRVGRKCVNQKTLDDIIKRRNGGETYNSIARSLGISNVSVKNYFTGKVKC